MDDVWVHFLGLPHGTTPAAVTTNKNIKMSSFKNSEKQLKRKRMGQTDMFRFVKRIAINAKQLC